MTPDLGFDLLVAALVGLAVGLEREWSGHSTGPDARFAGLRTFSMLGAIGGLGGWFLRIGQPVASACLLSGAVLFAIVAYASTMRRPGSTVDGTTEVAALLVVGMGVTAGLGNRALASGSATLLLVLLAEKSTFQNALQRIGAAELRATLQFAVLALVVLPLIPSEAYGPYDAFQPRQLWTVVLLFSALNFGGYIARRIVGETQGLGITGLLGGLVSSTAVTLAFSRRSRKEPELSSALAFGVAAACTVLLLRVLVVATVLQPALFAELLPLLGAPFIFSAGMFSLVFWRERPRHHADHASADPATPRLEDTTHTGIAETKRPDPSSSERNAAEGTPGDVASANGMQNPLALWTSIQMAIAFQLVLFLIAWVQATVGNPGILASAALLGLTDMDALTLSMTRLANDGALTHVAALAIGIGVIANTVLKLCVALVLGGAPYRPRAGSALLALGAISGLALWWRW